MQSVRSTEQNKLETKREKRTKGHKEDTSKDPVKSPKGACSHSSGLTAPQRECVFLFAALKRLSLCPFASAETPFTAGRQGPARRGCLPTLRGFPMHELFLQTPRCPCSPLQHRPPLGHGGMEGFTVHHLGPRGRPAAPSLMAPRGLSTEKASPLFLGDCHPPAWP